MIRVMLLLLFVSVVGCAKHAGNLVFHDASGRIVASGNIEIPKKLPDDGGTFEGAWSLLTADDEFPKRPADKGTYHAAANGRIITVNLDPKVQDNNLILTGEMGDDLMRGNWSYGIIRGKQEGGRFLWNRHRMDNPPLTQAD